MRVRIRLRQMPQTCASYAPRPGFMVSLVLHSIALWALSLIHVGTLILEQQPESKPKYSVLILRLEDFPAARPSGPKIRAWVASKENRSPEIKASAGDRLEAGQPQAAPRPALPPTARKTPAKQTLVQFDVSYEVPLRREIPLPTAVLWDQPPPVRKQFVAPVRQEPKPAAELPLAPDLSPPNQALRVADLKIAEALRNENARLVRPPAKTAPLNGEGARPTTNPAQVAADPTGASPTALISLPDNPAMLASTVVVPPANQIAASGVNSSGAFSNGRGAGKATSASSGSDNPNNNAGKGIGSSAQAAASAVKDGVRNSGGSTANHSAGQTSGAAAATQTALIQGSGPSSPTGVMTAASSPARANDTVLADRPEPLIPGTTRLNLPKDGRFAVVVTGSSGAGPYTQSVGALSGKMIYSVHIAVGLRKKWILQYCLTRGEEQKSNIKGRAEPIEAPWPYTVVRPENLGSSEYNYYMVHGILKADGHLDQLALVFPAEIEKKDLLMSSLNQWAFRPAKRDGVASQVEVLLIIPSQSE